jgi:RsiW-degrading membrane proteinase PrsW (M82 family)
VVEEMAKAILPLMVLEKSPWFFGSYLSIVLVGLLSGAVFASVENALYFFVYIPSEKLTQGTILWRLVVCTAMHVGCAALACSGLARAWSRARERLAEFEMSVAMPRLIAAVIIHGVYNLGALIFAILSR